MPRKDEQLLEELNEFQKEKERIRNIVGQIGGTHNSEHMIINFIFIILIVALLILGIVLQKYHYFDIGSSSFIRYLQNNLDVL